MSETSFNNSPEYDGFQAEYFLRVMTTGYDNGDFERDDVISAVEDYAHTMTTNELGEVQRVIQRHFSLLTGIHEAVVTEHVRRNPPNQSRMANPEE